MLNVRTAGWIPCLLLVAGWLAGKDLDIVINEVLYHAPADFEDAEYIELFNGGAEAVDISGWKLTLGVTLAVPAGKSIPAGGYLLLVKNASVAAALYPGVALVGNYAGSLSNGGERLRLENDEGTLIDEFDYHDDDGWPRQADGEGASLERLSAYRDPSFRDSWGASLTLLGSPGKINTQYREVQTLDLILAGEDWRYLKGTEEPAADWMGRSFDDASWLTGPTGIGYGDGDDATILEDMQDGYSTVYFRKRFDVSDPTTILSLEASIDYDDGFVLYLNGVEVARPNAGGTPGVPLPFDAVTSANRDAGVPEVIDLSADKSLLVAGTNVLAIHGVNYGLASTDFSMIPELRAEAEIIGIDLALNRIVMSSVIPRSSTWGYFKGTDEPAGALGEWTGAAYDDSAWLTGPAGFGYSDGDDATVLADMLNGYTSLYIRKKFALADVSSLAGMTLGVDYDDGFIAYLNGTEVARAYGPGTAGEFQLHTETATGSHEAGTEATFDLQAHIGLLVAGDNVLAIHGFNQTIGSGDFSLHPRLTLLSSVAADPSALRSTVSINEVYPAGSGEGWVELYNAGSDAADVSEYGLSDDPVDPLRHTMPPSTVILPGEFLVLTEATLGFQLAQEGTLILTGPSGIVLVDGMSYSVPDPLLSAGSHPDGDPDVSVLESPTGGSANAAPPDHGVVINEIMYHPLATPPEEELEWIELHNRTGAAVSLAGWSFTRGIDFEFSAGTTIPAGGYLAVAGNPSAVAAKYGITGVVGGYSSGLRNDDELLVLKDHLGNVADSVHYADDGRWPADADGTGPSAELVNPGLDNHTGMAWRASAGEGTPGAPNSRLAATAAPLVTRFKHFPPVPRSGQAVLVTAEVEGLDPIVEVSLYYRKAGDPAFAQVILLDDGLSGDGAAADSVYGGTLPGQPSDTVVEFFLEAQDAAGLVQLVPPTAPAQCNLYIVDDPPADPGVPVYRLVMTPADRLELETRDVTSNVLLSATFISGSDIFYRVGVRYRGESSRIYTPKSYRVDFTDDEEFEGIKHLNLNSHLPQHQHLGMRLFRAADVPASLTRIAHFVFCTDAGFSVNRIEEVGEDFLRRYYAEPDDEDSGNLYRGIDEGNLDYRGTDPESYRPNYKKETNEEEDDWTDLTHLCDVLTNTPAESLPTALPAVIDVDEWIRFFAVHTLISTQEGCIYRDKGDDYFLYRRPSDGLFVLIPWDVDDSFRQPTERLFRPSLPQIARILQHPDFSTSYYQHLVRLSGSHFSAERMADELGLLAGLFPQTDLDNDFTFVQSRAQFVDTGTNQQFTVNLGAETIVARGAQWKYFKGFSEPSGGTLDWTLPSFDDSTWDSGPSGIGYGDGDDATVLADMLNGYTTVYARQAFEVTDPESIEAMELAVDYDDGFIAFLNGVEIARSNAGAAGTYPAFDSVASAQREAGAYQVFDVSSNLISGTNVLAVVGLNLTIDSTDFSLIPELRMGGVVGEGCAGEVYMTGGQVVLTGLAPVTQTRYVRVNGVDVAYDHISGAWSDKMPLEAGSQQVTVQALDKDLAAVATQVLTITRVHTVGGAISEDTTWTKAMSPLLVTSSVTVPAGVHLSIEPGVKLFIDEGSGFAIAGEIKALGTAEEKILFTRIPCHENWGFFSFQSTQLASELRYCEFSYSTASPGCITVQGSRLDVESCHIHDITGEGVSAFSSTFNIRNTIVERTNESLSIDYCRTIVEFNTIRNSIGKSDLCDANGSNNPPARIAFNTMYGTSDDAIDADNGSVYAEGNYIRNCGDQGISLVGTGTSTVYRNVVYRNGVGLSVKDSHVATADFNTFAYNTSVGARAYQKNSGKGGGIGTIKNSIIWGSPTPLYTDALGTLTVLYSDIQGGQPSTGNITWGIGNISLDPQFVNASANDYRLKSTSPCIGVAEGGDDMGALPYELLPRAPSSLAVTGTTSASISLGWVDNSNVETAFELERRISAGFMPQYLISEGDAWRFFRGRSEPSGGTLDWTAADFDDGGNIQALVARGADWKFFRGLSEPSGGTLDWTQAAFDDSAWETGPTGIGYADGDDATVLSDMMNSYTTVYARHAFEVADPSSVTALNFSMDYDDGFIAFLNGTEIARAGAGDPGTYPAYDGVASASREAGTAQVFSVSNPQSLLVAGTNVLSVVGLNYTIDSTDFSLIPELTTGSTAWEQGPSGIGYGDGDDATLLSDMQGQYTTVYMRRSFDIADASGITMLELIVDFDDGYVAFLNGVEIARENAGSPGTFRAHSDLATADHEAGTPAVIEVPVAGILVTGTNVLAVQGLNVLLASTDFSLVPELRTVDETPYSLLATLPPNTRAYVDEAISAEGRYSYRVRAINASGASAYSNTVSVEAGTLPAAPTDLVVTAFDEASVSLDWRDNADSEDTFELERSVAGGEFELLVSLPADTVSYVDTAVVPSQYYGYRVRAVNIFGASAYSNEVTQYTGTPPQAPGNLTVTEVTAETVALAWTDNSDNETGFEIEISVGGGPFQPWAAVGADITTYEDDDLEPGQTYAFRARARNEAGYSDYSNVATTTTERPPAAPTGLTVDEVGLDFIDLAWTDASDNETGFEVERRAEGAPDFTLLAQLPEGQTTYRDSGLAQGATFTYRIRAVNEFGASAYSAEVTGTTGRLPAAPSGLLVGAVDIESVDLSWLDNSDNETRFELERQEGEGPFAKIAELPQNTVSHVDSGLAQGTQYGYRIRAVNSFGESPYSNVAVATTARLPAAPSGLVLTSLGYDSVSFTWLDNSDNETGFEIDRSQEGGPFAKVGQVSQNGTAFNEGGLLQGTQYAYRVRAVNSFGSSEPSPELSLTTGRLPAAPAGLAAEATGLTRVDLGWADLADNETGFELERKAGEGGAYLKIADLAADSTFYGDEGVQPGRTYSYRVRAVNEFGPSAYSGEASVLTPSLPDAPMGLILVSADLDSVTIAWTDASDNETGFEIDRSDDGSTFSKVGEAGEGATQFTDSGLESGKTFLYRVRAVNEYGTSPPSGTLSATTGRLPVAPSGIALVGVTLSTATILWADLSDNETGFEIDRSDDGSTFSKVGEAGEGATQFTDSGLESGEQYIYRVRAVNEYGTSPPSATLAVTTGRLPAAPGSPTLLSVTLSTATIRWLDLSDNETGFEIDRSDDGSTFSKVGEAGEGATQFTDSGLLSGYLYVYRVRAVNAHGSSEPSGTIEATTGRLPAAPADLALVGVTLDSVTLSWTDASDNETGFEIDRSDDGLTFSKVGEAPQGATGATDSGLLSGETYVYRVRAVNEHGTSPPSGTLEATTGRLPAAPADLALVGVTLDSVTLSWTDGSDNETGFEIDRSDDGSTFVKVGDAAEGATQHIDAGLVSGQTYVYRVRAVNAYGSSDPSGTLEATTGRLPAAPTQFSVGVLGRSALELSWNDEADNETGFELQRKGPADVDFLPLVTLGADVTSHADQGLPPRTLYEYRIRALNEFGASPYAPPASATTLPAEPEITSVTPSEGVSTGGTEIVIVGKNFLDGAAVTIGGQAVLDLVISSETEIYCTTPEGVRGSADVQVTVLGESAVLAGGFRYYDLHVRGNANNDLHGLNISDPISILLYLFLGGIAPPCDDVADVNADGLVNLTDPVYLLNYLFIAGPPIVPETAKCY